MSWRDTIISTDVNHDLNAAFGTLLKELKKQTFIDHNKISSDLKKQLTPHWKESIKEQVRHGINGKDGRDGLNGKDGKPGPKGEKGDRGESGKDGIDGKDGRDGKDAATWHFLEKADDAVGSNGDLCITSDFDIYLKENDEWVHKGTVKGSSQGYVGGVGQQEIQFKNEGENLGPVGTVTAIDFVGSGVSATRDGNSITVSVSSGGGGQSRSVNTVSTNTNAGSSASTDYIYLVSNGITITLPTAVGNTNLYTIKKTDTSTVTIATTGGQTIDGSASIELINQNVARNFLSNGSNWVVI